MSKNKITTITRRNIADELTSTKLWYHGRLKESDFLNRLYDLSKMPSTDYRSEYNNAYKDIQQHVDRNSDWEPDWVFTDNRFNLMHCDDLTYLRFLRETLNPAVRPQDGRTEEMVAIYNQYLAKDGYEFYKVDEKSGVPIFEARLVTKGQSDLAAKAIAIKKYLDTEYVNGKIKQMNQAVHSDTDLALGTGKELLETICKSILQKKSVPIDKGWTLPQLLKATTAALDFKPKAASDPAGAEKSIKQILGGISTIVQGVAELRNAYGTGHGKAADFQKLESAYAQLYVGVVAEIALIYLATNGEIEIATS
jgi:hypothetical protein